jgi:hypothetical protein
MERAYLVRLKRANDCVKHATIMEQDQVLFLPVMRIDQLAKKGKQEWYRENEKTYIRCNGGALHLVQQIPHLL